MNLKNKTLLETKLNLEDSNQAAFFKMACNDEDQVSTLLTFYREKVAAFDSRRQEWLDKYQVLKVSEEEKHILEWES